jgi:hypothetical protein
VIDDNDIIFHDPSHDISVYFVDPWGNSIEIITHYDVALKLAFPKIHKLYETAIEK